MTENRADALARLDIFVGEWVVEAHFAGDQTTAFNSLGKESEGLSRFAWDLDRQFLVQRTEIPIPEAPESLAIVNADLQSGAYTQHYFDSRGVARLYAMKLEDGVWTLRRESPDFTSLDFGQRFTGTISADGNTISGAWEKRLNGDWDYDFALTYRRTR